MIQADEFHIVFLLQTLILCILRFFLVLMVLPQILQSNDNPSICISMCSFISRLELVFMLQMLHMYPASFLITCCSIYKSSCSILGKSDELKEIIFFSLVCTDKVLLSESSISALISSFCSSASELRRP